MLKLTSNILFILVLILMSGCMTTMRTLVVDQDNMGPTREKGYLFFALTTEWYITSIELESDNDIKMESFNRWTSRRDFFLAPVPLGHYKITRINLTNRRYFELENDELVFDFRVEPNVINYVGELSVKRSPDNRAYFELINRSSIALEFLENKFPQILANRELRYTGPGHDNFFELTFHDKSVKESGGAK